MGKDRFSFVIPVYNHENKICYVIKKALAFDMHIIVVDDGSTDSTYNRIKNIEGITILRHRVNLGKGAALLTGFSEALKISDWAISIDADGQHDPGDAMKMIQSIPDNKRPIIIGNREGMSGKDIPWTSSFGRKFSNFWVKMSGGPKLEDTQSGFRIYPLPESINLDMKARRFEFEVEILVKANWKKIPFVEVPVSVNYKPGGDRISHFRPFVDFVRNSLTFTRLIVQRIFIPYFIRCKV